MEVHMALRPTPFQSYWMLMLQFSIYQESHFARLWLFIPPNDRVYWIVRHLEILILYLRELRQKFGSSGEGL